MLRKFVNIRAHKKNAWTMFKNLLLTAWRNLKKNPFFSAINIAGLAIGLTVCMLIIMYVEHETSYDHFHDKANRICWVWAKINFGNDSLFIPDLSYVSGPMIKQNGPEVEDYLRMAQERRSTVIQNPASPDLKFTEDKFYFTDNNFFSFFSFKLLRGNKQTVLQKPFSIVISQRVAEKYFGARDAVGKILRFNSKYNFTVTGVAEKAPSNSTIEYDFIASISSLTNMSEEKRLLSSNNIEAGSFATYFLLKQESGLSQLKKQLAQVAANGDSEGGNKMSFIVTPLTSTHLDANYADASRMKYLKIFPFVAGLVLFLALINYMSLSTARSTTRSKEIGVRKTMGANRWSIAIQFIVESALFTLVAFVLACFLCILFQPVFFNYLSIDIDRTFLYNRLLIISFILLFILTLFLAAIYPAVLLSAYRPIKVLYGRLSKQSGAAGVRKFFTVLQFTISVMLLICGIVIDRQMYFFKHAETGVNRDHVIMMPFANPIGKHYPAFKEEIQSLAAIKQVSAARFPMYKGYNIFSVKPKYGNEPVTLPVISADENFIPLLGLQWKTAPADSLWYLKKNIVILNEAAVAKLNLGDNPLHEKVDSQYVVEGVLKNFNYTTLQNKIDALAILIQNDNDTSSDWAKGGGCLFVKTTTGAITSTVLDKMKTVYEKYDTNKPFEYFFMDETYDAMYKAEDKMLKIFYVFTAFTILIASLGVFGLAAFMATQRIKEIGIRKVLGATTSGITVLLSKDFIKLILISIIIASPVAWWAMDKWLQDFAYRIHISWWMFAVAALLTIIIAIATISYQAIKAALANPVDSLRRE